jgi:hypothetical protein
VGAGVRAWVRACARERVRLGVGGLCVRARARVGSAAGRVLETKGGMVAERTPSPPCARAGVHLCAVDEVTWWIRYCGDRPADRCSPRSLAPRSASTSASTSPRPKLNFSCGWAGEGGVWMLEVDCRRLGAADTAGAGAEPAGEREGAGAGARAPPLSLGTCEYHHEQHLRNSRVASNAIKRHLLKVKRYCQPLQLACV